MTEKDERTDRERTKDDIPPDCSGQVYLVDLPTLLTEMNFWFESKAISLRFNFK